MIRTQILGEIYFTDQDGEHIKLDVKHFHRTRFFVRDLFHNVWEKIYHVVHVNSALKYLNHASGKIKPKQLKAEIISFTPRYSRLLQEHNFAGEKQEEEKLITLLETLQIILMILLHSGKQLEH